VTVGLDIEELRTGDGRVRWWVAARRCNEAGGDGLLEGGGAIGRRSWGHGEEEPTNVMRKKNHAEEEGRGRTIP
jgi:hypothetical protein